MALKITNLFRYDLHMNRHHYVVLLRTFCILLFLSIMVFGGYAYLISNGYPQGESVNIHPASPGKAHQSNP
jgi:hypothetical protein